MSSEWVNVDSLDSIQHEQSYFEVGLGVQLNTDWYENSVSPYQTQYQPIAF